MTDNLHPDFPVVSGKYQLTKTWQLDLSEEFNRRIDNESLVLWRPGLTFWIDIYSNDKGLTPDEQVKSFTKDASPSAYDKDERPGDTVSRTSYKLDENNDGKKAIALYSFTASSSGIVIMAVYGDSKEDLNIAYNILETVLPV